jgi:hypothetical protein
MHWTSENLRLLTSAATDGNVKVASGAEAIPNCASQDTTSRTFPSIHPEMGKDLDNPEPGHQDTATQRSLFTSSARTGFANV